MPSSDTKPLMVTLGIPGLDTVFPDGLSPGSLVAISGPPGCGKTIMTLQLLLQMQWSNQQVDTRKALYLSCDEPPASLRHRLSKVLPDPKDLCLSNDRMPVLEWLPSNFDTILEAYQAGVPLDLDSLSVAESDPIYRKVRRDSVSTLVSCLRYVARGGSVNDWKDHMGLPEAGRAVPNRGKHATPSHSLFNTADPNPGAPCACRAIAIDGLLNLSELRGADPSERREALRLIGSTLRNLVQGTPTCLAGILTLESSSDQLASTDFEDFLVDVVIHLRVDSPIKGKRRRLLEVTKCRDGQHILGEHSLWIMPQNEIDRRARAHRHFGWSERTQQTIRRGIVVFPRLTWREGAKYNTPEEHDDAFYTQAIALKDMLSHDREARGHLLSERIQHCISNVVRGLPPGIGLDELDDYRRSEERRVG